MKFPISDPLAPHPHPPGYHFCGCSGTQKYISQTTSLGGNFVLTTNFQADLKLSTALSFFYTLNGAPSNIGLDGGGDRFFHMTTDLSWDVYAGSRGVPGQDCQRW